jgi:N-dimethylarginine dimethylaminohydrolase
MPDVFDAIQPDGEHSVFTVCRPNYLSTKVSNNVFMEGKNKQKPDVPKAINQWDRTMHIMESLGVELLEIPPMKGCQDQVFTANVGLSIGKTMVLANYSAPGRACEVPPARDFFTKLGLNCIQPPFAFEGYADCRKWKPGFYFGGYGQFSDNRAFDWIEQQCGVKIIRLKEINPATYHEDCCLMVVDEENFLVTPGSLDDASIATLKKCGNVHMTPTGIETTGITNGVLINEKRIMLSGAFNPEQPNYRKAMDFLLETMDKLGYTMLFVEANAFEPSGGDLSCICLVMDFNPQA